MKTKKCITCGNDLPVEKFAFESDKSTIRRPECKACAKSAISKANALRRATAPKTGFVVDAVLTDFVARHARPSRHASVYRRIVGPIYNRVCYESVGKEPALVYRQSNSVERTTYTLFGQPAGARYGS